MVRNRLSAAAAALTVAALVVVPAVTSAEVHGPIWATGPVLTVPGPAALRDVSVLGANDVWTVGTRSSPSLPLVARWMGDAWMSVLAPDEYDLVAVDAVPSGDVWVAGSLKPLTGSQIAPLLARYHDGEWLAVSIALPEGASGKLTDVDMRSDGDGWAVGSVSNRGFTEPLILRGVAGRWGRVALPLWATHVELSAVHAAGPQDAWAVGALRSPDNGWSALVLRWDGARWEREALPPADPGAEQELNGVSGDGRQVWAVGESCIDGLAKRMCEAVALRRKGQAWEAVQTAGQDTYLMAVVVVSDDDMWVFGYATSSVGNQREHIEHWDGSAFTVVSLRPTPPPHDFPAAGLVAANNVPGTTALWAVGWLNDPTNGRPRVMRYQ